MDESERRLVREKKRCTRFVKMWRERLGLSHWRIDHTYHDGPFLVDGALDSEATASCLARWQYQSASLNFNVRETEQLDDERLEEVVIHELGHILVNEMRPLNLPAGWVRDASDAAHEEHVVTLITNAILYTSGRR